MIAEERVVGVLVLATTDEKRAFAAEELSLLQAVAAEAALAFERLRSGAALAEALEREQRAAEIVRRLRAELDPDGVVRVARDELGNALCARRDHDRRLGRRRAGRRRARSSVDGRRAEPRRDRPVRDRRGGSHRRPARRPLAPGARAARLLPHRLAAGRAASRSRRPTTPPRRRRPRHSAATSRRCSRAAPEGSSSSAVTSFGPRFASCRSRRHSPMPPRTVRCSRRPTSRATAASATRGVEAPFSSLLAIPVRGEQAELVLVFFDEAHTFSRDDLELAQQVAGAARGAFERSRLFDAERTRALAVAAARANGQPARDRSSIRSRCSRPSSSQAVDLLRAMPRRSRRSTSASSWSRPRRATAPTKRSALGRPPRRARRATSSGRARRRPTTTRRRTTACAKATSFLAAGHAAYLGVPLARSRRRALRRVVGLRAIAARVA